MESSYTWMYIQFFFSRYISKSQRYTNYLNLTIFFGTVQVCSPSGQEYVESRVLVYTYTYIYTYLVLKNAFKLICNINMFLFSSERQDAQGRRNRRASHEDPRTPPILEDHLPHQHLRDARRLPTPHPPQTKRSPKERGKPGGSGAREDIAAKAESAANGSKNSHYWFPSFLINSKFLLTFPFLSFFKFIFRNFFFREI